MKKTSLLLIAISLILCSCVKDPQNDWNRFYDFTQADVVGHFEANPDESLYEELPTEGVAVYDNATMDVTAVGNNSISLHIIIPGRVNKTFSGSLTASSDITLTNIINDLNKEDIMMTVYKNGKGQVRFHGRVKRYYYRIDSETQNKYLYRSENWGFDVIKQE
ncbi:MAG: hypothetical protein II887_07835 [Bacteroidales bacterium]|nr:hypothetical protein [Bacteroidales bacterium]